VFTDAHCHPFDLLRYLQDAEGCRRSLGVACAASAWNREQFEYHESLKATAEQDGAPPVLACFAVHPQLPAGGGAEETEGRIGKELLPLLETLAGEGRLDAVGETGFDLYNDEYRATEKTQDEMFTLHLETALRSGLPLVLNVRRAMNKIFAHTRNLKKAPAVIFHSWPGTLGEAEALLRRGVNVYFSFGAPVLTNRRELRRCCALLPGDRLLLETDAPYQPARSLSHFVRKTPENRRSGDFLPCKLRKQPDNRGFFAASSAKNPQAQQAAGGRPFSSWQDLPLICRGAADLRKAAGSPGGTPEELEALTAANFFRAFRKPGSSG
jgi:TatD DNase family protein